jgi:hypothetical protein
VLGTLEAELPAGRLTVISTPPLVAFLTSSAKRTAFLVWKLPSGQTVDKSHLVCAIAEALPKARIAVAMRANREVAQCAHDVLSEPSPSSSSLAYTTVFASPAVMQGAQLWSVPGTLPSPMRTPASLYEMKFGSTRIRAAAENPRPLWSSLAWSRNLG